MNIIKFINKSMIILILILIILEEHQLKNILKLYKKYLNNVEKMIICYHKHKNKFFVIIVIDF